MNKIYPRRGLNCISLDSLGKVFAFCLISSLFISNIVSAQEAEALNFFDLANSNVNTSGLTCWGGGKAYAWTGSPTTFLNCTGATTGGDVPVDMSIGAGSLVLTTTRPGGSGWSNVQFKPDGGHTVNFLRYGAEDELMLHLRLKWGAIASGANYYIKLYDNHSIWNLYATYNGIGGSYSNNNATVSLASYVTASTNWQDVYIPISDFKVSNSKIDLTKISFIEFSATGNYSATNTMYIEKMRITRGIDVPYTDMVKVNQLGYTPNGRKLAIVSYEGTISPAPTYFQIKNIDTNEIVYQSTLELKNVCSSIWNKSGDTIYHANFTNFTTPGRYVLTCPELMQTSVEFVIGKKAFDNAMRDCLRFFYYARSAQEIAEPFAEGHTRPSIYANNSQPLYDYDDNNTSKKYDYDLNNIGITRRDVAGGWFDAGDLHIDVHNNVTTLWFLLELLEQHKDKFGPDTLNLPESDGSINDLVLLIKWKLDWFKKMQNFNGSVHFIVTAVDAEYYQEVSDISTGSASILAGTFAKAYVLLKDVPGMESYANDLLARAQMSWNWLKANSSVYVPIMKYGGGTEYYAKPIDTTTEDNTFRKYAAVELYIATGTSEYKTYFEASFPSTGNTTMQGITAFGKAHMDYAKTTRPVNSTYKSRIVTAYTNLANTLVTNVNCNPYTIPTTDTSGNLWWGSSGLIACNAYTLLKVYEWTGNTTYRDAALDALEWICGRNPVNRIFITGYGDALHGTDIYSFYWFDYLNPPPGYLCGNINTQDFLYLYKKYPYKYFMNVQNASTLEPCLPWQAELCYLISYFAYDLKLPETVDFTYFAEFANAWQATTADANWNPDCDIALPADGVVDAKDLAVLAEKWLQ